jgi:hypothetical protein
MRQAKVLGFAGCALILMLAGCGTATSEGAARPVSVATRIPRHDDGRHNPLEGVRVPDAFTSVVVHPLSTSAFPFLGSDGRYHVAYDLELTNASRVPATVARLDVVDAHHPTRVVDSISGTELVDVDCPFGNCNRLRRLPSAPATDTMIPAQESRSLFVDFAFDSLAEAPTAVLHHFYGTGAVGPPSSTATPIDYLAAPFDISSGKPLVISPPVRGKNWVALNGCCEPGFPHRSSLSTFNGSLINSQRFAIDWKETNDDGEFYVGDRNKNESYIDYGATIYAVADGTISSTLDTLDPNPPGVLPANDPVLGPKLTIETVDGNNIVENLGHGVWAFYAHLQKGSLLVKPGDRVHKGQKIAELGNTGNSNASHLHFHLMDGPSVLGSDGLPYVLDRFDYRGQVAPQTIADADDFLSGEFFSTPLPPAQRRRDQLPLALAIVDFRER